MPCAGMRRTQGPLRALQDAALRAAAAGVDAAAGAEEETARTITCLELR